MHGGSYGQVITGSAEPGAVEKLAKDLVKAHEEKQPAALALIREHLPAAAGKSDEETARYLFALHDAQSVIARQHGFRAGMRCARRWRSRR